MSLSDRTGISVAADPDAIAYLRQWEVGRGMEKLSRGLITSSAAIALVRMPDLSPENAVHGGRAVQRLWLKATELNIAAQPISAPIFMGVHERYDREGIYSTSERSELSAIHSRLLDLFGVAQGEPLFMLRLDHADPPMVRSLRRPISEFFHIHQPVVA